MRLRIYIDGKPQWSDQGPSAAHLSGIRGAMVEAHPTPDAARRAAKVIAVREWKAKQR